jgi:hypothetical protein
MAEETPKPSAVPDAQAKEAPATRDKNNALIVLRDKVSVLVPCLAYGNPAQYGKMSFVVGRKLASEVPFTGVIVGFAGSDEVVVEETDGGPRYNVKRNQVQKVS